MNNLTKSLIIFGLILIWSPKLKSQINDFQTWSNISLSKEFDSDIKISISEELRMYNNSSEIDEFFTELAVDYKVSKIFEFGLGYRFTRNFTSKGNKRFEQRFDANATFDFSVKRFDFEYRLKYQTNDEELFDQTSNKTFVSTLRNRAKISYNIKNIKLEPYISSDLFYTIDLKDISEFSKIRNAVGFEYEFSKHSSIDTFLMFEREFHKKTLQRVLVFGLTYKYKFK